MDDLLNHVPCGILEMGEDEAIRRVNTALSEMVGASEEELAGRPFNSILTVSSRIFHQTHLYPLLRMQGRFDEVYLTLASAGGERVPVIANGVRKSGGDGTSTLCVFMPVHERKKYEDEILHAKKRAEEAVHSNEELRKAKEELERHARELDRQITRLEAKNRELRRLSTILSHDLREPIRKASLFADVLEAEADGQLSPSVIDTARKIKDAFSRQDRLLTQLQEYLTVGSGGGKFTKVDLGEVVDEAARAAMEAFERDDLCIEREELPAVDGRRNALHRLFYNVIENAIKFSKPDAAPQIRIEGAVVQHNSFRKTTGRYRYIDFAQVTIKDEGIGFDARYTDYVLGALKKLDPQTEGLGLGLAVSQKIVEQHHGSLAIDSELGKGTMVRILLPLRQ